MAALGLKQGDVALQLGAKSKLNPSLGLALGRGYAIRDRNIAAELGSWLAKMEASIAPAAETEEKAGEIDGHPIEETEEVADRDEQEQEQVAETDPPITMEHEELERLRKAKHEAKRGAEAKARLKPVGKGKLDDARAERAAADVAAMVTKPRPRNLSEIRPELRVLRRKMQQRQNALVNASKHNTNAFVSQVARDPVDVSRWWLAIAVARLLYGPDATLAQIAETRWRLDKRDHLVDDDTPIEDRPNRWQARTAIERSLKLEQKGKPWQRYSTL